MKSTYKRLGDYIRQVDVRNVDDKRYELLGVSVEKCFISSIANTVGTDWHNYKVIKKGQFCYIPDTSRRGDKIGIAHLVDREIGLVSAVYTVFEVWNRDLIPEYLMLWFKRPEFDRYARYHSHGSVREIFDWEEMCNVELPIPPIEEQQKIVDAYQTIEHRIALKKKINENLEAQAYEIYKKYLSLSDLKCGKISDLADKIVCGKTPSTNIEQNFDGDIPFITIPDMHDKVFAIKTERCISRNAATCLIPKNSVCVSCIASAGLVDLTDRISQTNQQINTVVCKESVSPYYVYFQMKELSEYIRQIGSCGSTTCNLSKSGFSNIEIEIPCKEIQEKISFYEKPIFNAIKENQKEIDLLNRLSSTLLTKLSSC